MQRRRPTDLAGSLEKISTRVSSDGGVVVVRARLELEVLLVVGVCGLVRCSSPVSRSRRRSQDVAAMPRSI
jgi:hypothetical protein